MPQHSRVRCCPTISPPHRLTKRPQGSVMPVTVLELSGRHMSYVTAGRCETCVLRTSSTMKGCLQVPCDACRSHRVSRGSAVPHDALSR